MLFINLIFNHIIYKPNWSCRKDHAVYFFFKIKKTQFIIYIHIRKNSYNLKQLISPLKKTSKIVKKINKQVNLVILQKDFNYLPPKQNKN